MTMVISLMKLTICLLDLFLFWIIKTHGRENSDLWSKGHILSGGSKFHVRDKFDRIIIEQSKKGIDFNDKIGLNIFKYS